MCALINALDGKRDRAWLRTGTGERSRAKGLVELLLEPLCIVTFPTVQLLPIFLVLRITEPSRFEKAFEIIKSNPQTDV